MGEERCVPRRSGLQQAAYRIVIPSPNVTGRLHMGHTRDHPLRYLLGGVLMGKLRPGYRRLTLGARATLSR